MFSVLLVARWTPTSKSLVGYLQNSVTVHVAASEKEIVSKLLVKHIDIVVVEEDSDVQFINQSLDCIYAQNTTVPVVVYSAQENSRVIIDMMKKGLDDYFLKNLNFDEFRASLASCVHKSSPLHGKDPEDTGEAIEVSELHGSSNHTKKLRRFVQKFGPKNVTIMLYGESGTGKTLVARLLHKYSSRKLHNFLSINCAAIPHTLVESELFGSEMGAFTGAVKRRGAFTRAHRGTLFLDELGDFPLYSQGKILQAIEEKKYTPLGSEQEFTVDVRCISATNKNIRQMIDRNEFRADLYYRMAIISYTIPPLRERAEDIIPLAWQSLLVHDCDAFFTHSAMDKLTGHSWPGNIRELHNCVARAAMSSEKNSISARQITFDI